MPPTDTSKNAYFAKYVQEHYTRRQTAITSVDAARSARTPAPSKRAPNVTAMFDGPVERLKSDSRALSGRRTGRNFITLIQAIWSGSGGTLQVVYDWRLHLPFAPAERVDEYKLHFQGVSPVNRAPGREMFISGAGHSIPMVVRLNSRYGIVRGVGADGEVVSDQDFVMHNGVDIEWELAFFERFEQRGMRFQEMGTPVGGPVASTSKPICLMQWESVGPRAALTPYDVSDLKIVRKGWNQALRATSAEVTFNLLENDMLAGI